MAEFSSINESHRQALHAFNDVALRIGTPFVMVGAGARLVAREQGLYGTEVRDLRATGDFDFGVQLRSWADYAALERALLPDFERGDNFRFTHLATRVAIDLIPFGGVEREGRVRPPKGDETLVVRGFEEALEHGLTVNLDGLRLPVAREPGIMILKFFAFNDRNETKDLRDIWQIMLHYAVTDERIFAELSDELIAGRFEYEEARVPLLGMDMGRIMRPDTFSALEPIVRPLADEDNPVLARLPRGMLDQEPLERAARTFGLLRYGLAMAAPSS